MAKIYITGIAGFIGFHLALFLKKRGDFVAGCDNFNAYYDTGLKRARAEYLKQQGISILEADICEPANIEKELIEQSTTHLVHLAAQAGVRHSITHPQSYVQANLNGFVQILEICRRLSPIKCIYASSSSVYGLNKKIPFSEQDPCDHPANFYGATKKANEMIAHAYHHLYGISVTGLRYFTVYGPWGRPDMAYFSFTKSILEGKPIHLYNQGQMRRDFTYIDDIVRGTAAAIDLGASCEIFNLGNNHPENLSTLVSLIEKFSGKKAVVELLPMQMGEVVETYADIAKAKDKLGFVPSTSLEEGLERFVEWYQPKSSLTGIKCPGYPAM